jgi:hypothetical protein
MPSPCECAAITSAPSSLRSTVQAAQLQQSFSTRWFEDAARCCSPTLDDCSLFEDPVRLPERSLVLR